MNLEMVCLQSLVSVGGVIITYMTHRDHKRLARQKYQIHSHNRLSLWGELTAIIHLDLVFALQRIFSLELDSEDRLAEALREEVLRFSRALLDDELVEQFRVREETPVIT